MRKTFASIDDTLIERLFQPVTDLLANRLGFGRTSAACLCIDAASLSWIMSRARGLSDDAASWQVAPSLFDAGILLLGLVALLSLRTLFRRTGTRQANPLRLAMRPHRALVLLMLAARLVQLQASGLSGLADMAMLVCAASALYLGACGQPPRLRHATAWVPASQ